MSKKDDQKLKKEETQEVAANEEAVVEESTEKKIDERTHNDKGEKFNWYIINSYSGHEDKVANKIKQRIIANALESDIPEVIVPKQEKIVAVAGKKKNVSEKIFPGYIIIKMVVNDHTWHLIRNTDGVIGFVGVGQKPTPLSEKEVKAILSFMDVKQPSYQVAFRIGDAVKVVDGPFKEFVGSIKEINEDKGQVTVLLSIFGRETPVFLDFLQISKL